MTAGELADRFSHSWSTTTRHLQKLVAADLVRVEKHGRERLYTLDAVRLRTVTSRFLDVFTALGGLEHDHQLPLAVLRLPGGEAQQAARHHPAVIHERERARLQGGHQLADVRVGARADPQPRRPRGRSRP